MQDQFYASERSDELPFVVNDSVRVVRGAARGAEGSVVGIGVPEPLSLVVDFGDGSDMTILAADLVPMGDDGN